MIKNEIKGTANQMVVCQGDPEQTVYCEAEGTAGSIKGLLGGSTD